MTAVEGVLITGTYGTGKTSVCEELAELLEAASVAYGAIERRLSTSVTIGRERDVQNAARWLREGIGTDVGDLVLANDRPVRHVAEAVLGWLRWT